MHPLQQGGISLGAYPMQARSMQAPSVLGATQNGLDITALMNLMITMMIVVMMMKMMTGMMAGVA